MFFKGTNLNRYVSSGELMHSIAISKQYHIINFKVAMILDFNCSYHQKKKKAMIILNIIDVLANTKVVIIIYKYIK